MRLLDTAIMKAYVAFDRPADQIVCDPSRMTAFRDLVNADLSESVDIATINKRLLNLRRRGEAKGGLPRLRRNYYGRNN